MNVRTAAIVLHLTPHSDKASILHLYTREAGRVPYLVYGRSKAAKWASPLTLVSLDAVHLSTRSIQSIRSIERSFIPLHETDMVRRTVAIFIGEVLFLTLVHPMADSRLYDWLESVVNELDTCSDPENHHLRFLLGLMDFLGFGIDLEDPAFAAFACIGTDMHISLSDRRTLLDALLIYASDHIPDWRTPKSADILREVFS